MIDRTQLLRERGNGRVLCNLAAGCDEDSIDAYLVKTQPDALAAGLRHLFSESTAAELLLYAPQGMDLSALIASLADLPVLVKHGPASPVLREESALYAAIQTGEIRSDPEGYALRRAYEGEGFDGKPTLIVDGETARYALETPRLHKLIRIQDAAPVEADIGASLESILRERDISSAKALLLGGNLGRFVPRELLSDTLVTSDRLFDRITLFSEADCMAQALSGLLAMRDRKSVV